MDWPSELSNINFRFLVNRLLIRETPIQICPQILIFYGLWIAPVHDASKINTGRVQNLSSHLYTMRLKKKLVVYIMCTRVVIFFQNLCTNYFAVS